MPEQNTVKTKADLLKDLNTSLATANTQAKNAEQKIKESFEIQKNLLLAIRQANTPEKKSKLEENLTKKEQAHEKLESAKIEKNKTVSNIAAQIKALSDEIYKDDRLKELADQEAKLKAAAPDITMLVLKLLQTTHTDNLQSLLEAVAQRFSIN